MLKLWQVLALILLGGAMWALVTWNIARHPEQPLDQARAVWGYAMAPIGGLISILLCKYLGRLKPEQLLPGVVLVGATAMMIDAIAIRWFGELYRASDRAMMMVGASLMWGYGVALAMTVAWVAWRARRSATAADS